MMITYPKGSEGQSDDSKKEPKWMTDFYDDQAKRYIIKRCDLLMKSGRRRDTEEIQSELDF